MVLSDKTIKDLIKKGEIFIDPFVLDNLQPSSLDCRIGNHFLVVDDHKVNLLDFSTPIQYREIVSKEFIIPPKCFVLATTIEYIKLPSYITAFVEGRSSIGRMGLFIQNAGWIDPGFEGNITLELFNANSVPIKIMEGLRIGQFVFCQLDSPVENVYRGKYLKQRSTTGSKLYLDKEIANI
ncbi:MAG: dCTP deaminase [Candidatus Dojkabacteria bacterium]|nr:dCTP deaminase [Candidatus Dojkabacteria bacterium]